MFTSIDEPIAVLGYYSNQRFHILKFRWRSTIYSVQEVTLTAKVKDGGVPWQYYSVTVQGNLYRVAHNQQSQQWLLKEVWCEG